MSSAAGASEDGAWFDRWETTYDGDRRLLISSFDAFYLALGEVAALRADGTGRTAGADGGPVRVLDLGAGTGLSGAALAATLPDLRLTLLDEAPGMLAHARERLSPLGDRLAVVEGDLLDDLPDGPFDVVASCLAIHHLPHERQAEVYAAAAARLAHGGLFVNAEQIAGPTPALEHHLLEREVRIGRAAGLGEAAEAAARERWSIDRHVPLEQHLAWLHAAGLDPVDCVMRSWRFAVVCGWRPEV